MTKSEAEFDYTAKGIQVCAASHSKLPIARKIGAIDPPRLPTDTSDLRILPPLLCTTASSPLGAKMSAIVAFASHRHRRDPSKGSVLDRFGHGAETERERGMTDEAGPRAAFHAAIGHSRIAKCEPLDRFNGLKPTILGLMLAAVLVTSVPATAQDSEWTVVTLARDGSWGVGTAELQGQAIASALRKCNAMSGRKSDCGAEIAAVKEGWTVGILCGDHRVLVAEKELAAAERAAQVRESLLQNVYGEGFPSCWRVLTVSPDGFAAASKVRAPATAKAYDSRNY
jgi:hypothetical protein